eukprot:TRINITY_DN7190_c0_g4_i5.p1 TRINITY_DN7190_c0_g4~~TRINITY_DN7190_c0_g4_i5.p1  ORF type:complete len:302 (-),score=75.73 TRINITY_DN7190_c0_g4_i5:255-1160(-)
MYLIDEEEKLLKKNKQKKANEKKTIGSKKRKAPEKQKFSNNFVSNARSSQRTNSAKATPSSCSERNSPTRRSDSRLRQAQSFLKKLLALNAKAILTKKAKIEETFNDILSETLTLDQLKSSRLGQDLQQFANLCRKNSLGEFQKTTQTVLNKLKEDVLLSLFGAEEANIDNLEITPKEESKIQANEQSNKKLKVIEEVKEEVKAEEAMAQNVDNKKAEASEVFLANAKEPAIMLIVCKEIAELLKKVLHLLNLEIYTGRQRGHRNGTGNRSQISRERFDYGVQLQEVGFKLDQSAKDGPNP